MDSPTLSVISVKAFALACIDSAFSWAKGSFLLIDAIVLSTLSKEAFKSSIVLVKLAASFALLENKLANKVPKPTVIAIIFRIPAILATRVLTLTIAIAAPDLIAVKKAPTLVMFPAVYAAVISLDAKIKAFIAPNCVLAAALDTILILVAAALALLSTRAYWDAKENHPVPTPL